MKSIFAFTPDSITCNGKTFPAEYSVTPSGAVFVFVQQEGAKEKTRVRFAPDHPDHAAALAAARNETPAPSPDPLPASAEERPETISAPEAPAAAPEGRSDQAPEDRPARNPKEARGPVPEKTFAGTEITGKGWKILFDEQASRTRIIFDGQPTDAARAAVESAGFYFSAALNSWNKKLTFRAYRAAQALSGELSAIYA